MDGAENLLNAQLHDLVWANGCRKYQMMAKEIRLTRHEKLPTWRVQRTRRRLRWCPDFLLDAAIRENHRLAETVR